MPLLTLRLLTPGLDFVRPYVERALSDVYTVISSPDEPSDTVLAICRATDEQGLDRKVINTMLITPDAVIGTGMNGLGRTLAEGVARGRLYHIFGNEARLSVIHATSLAQAARLVAGTPGRFVVAEEQPVTFHDLVEALATRINGRRVYTVSRRLAWWLMPPYLRRTITTDSIVTPDIAAAFPDFKPVSACGYLTTHDYSDDTI